MADETQTEAPETPAGIAPEPEPEPEPEALPPSANPEGRLASAGFRLIRGAWRRW